MAMKAPSSGSRDAEWVDEELDTDIMAEINITPLTDIFLVLLIIFMVTSSVMTQQGVSVDLPQASPAVAEGQADGVVVTLASRGEVLVNSQRVPQGQWGVFRRMLKKAFEATPSRLVILEGDKRAFLGSAVEVMDQARRVGAEKFAIATQNHSDQ